MSSDESISSAYILDGIPHIAMRLVYIASAWKIIYINKAVERWGYAKSEFANGKVTWTEMIHPDDRIVALKQAHDYLENNIDNFRLQYRILTKDGASIYITDNSHVNRGPDGAIETIDSYLVENLEKQISTDPAVDTVVKLHLALNDLLLTIYDAQADPAKTIQFILDRVGELIDCSRVMVFEDSEDHKTCKVVYEWLNHGISSIKDTAFAVNYSIAMPEIYIALQGAGFLIVNAGEIPENCREEFEAENIVSSAIFAVYQYGDHYGFVCFDDCIIERRWDSETVNFLKVVANLISNVIMNIQSAKYLTKYEEKIKELAFRDYQTDLPNHYPYDSDLADAILAAGSVHTPAHGVIIALDNPSAIIKSRGIKVVNAVVKTIAEEIQKILGKTLGTDAVLYRVTGTVFSVIVQPGHADAAADFAKQVAERGLEPWRVAAGDFRCKLVVASIPFGIVVTDPETIADHFDNVLIQSATLDSLPLVVETEESRG